MWLQQSTFVCPTKRQGFWVVTTVVARHSGEEAVPEGAARSAEADEPRHQSPLSETYRVSFETMRSVSLQSIWLFRFMSETVRFLSPREL